MIRLKYIFLCISIISFASYGVASDSPVGEFCKDLPRSNYHSLKRVDVSVADPENWFEVYEVFQGVHAIYEPHQWQEVISYLIEGKDKALLFDTGNGIADIAAVAKHLTDKPISVLNSHSHFDHVGGNYAFEKIYGLDTTFTKNRELGQPNSNIGIEVSPQALCRPLPNGVSQERHIGRPFKITNTVGDGSVIDLGGRRLEIIHIPGHTPDAIALIDREAGLLWTGDSYYAGPIWLFAQETDLTAYEASLQRLIGEIGRLKALLPAHNSPVQDPQNLKRVSAGYRAMLSGKTSKKIQSDGMVEHTIEGESNFAFLMRDDALPYGNLKEN